MVSTLKLTKIQIPNSDSDVMSLDASTGNITFNKTLGGTSITVQGEGTNTTNLQQGLCKGWCDYGTTGTAAISDSFNASGLTDHDTGTTTIANTTNMGNTNYVINGMTDTYNDANFSDIGGVFLITHGGDTRATGSVKIGTVDTYNANDKLDFDPVMITIFGDLA